ncbi:hypothetical protein ACQP1V_42790 (plasmid) [Microtetraspora malaysiensis]|uniref:hypothetical protein n=1 Tax=Microtetraspora malaysiensis TaxID=161358 RepID=UPI003D8F7853
MATETVLAAAGVISILANAAGGIYILVVKPGKKIREFTERAGDFLEDWAGVDGRPGVPGRPGVMVRLATIEEQLHPNHGGSLRDVVDRVERGQRRVEDTLAAHLAEHRVIASVARHLPDPDEQREQHETGGSHGD